VKKKLIEVALPLPELNDASAYDKMPGIGPHPKGIHHWWARLPLPTARAILFASVVDDPSEHPDKWPTEAAQDAERERLFDIVRSMMEKKLHDRPRVYAEARVEMLKHCAGKLPEVFDPFSGGGSIPLEANRLGLEAHAGDLNPVAVLLNKCNLELAPRWSGRPPVNPEDRKLIGGSDPWPGSAGLAADVRHYAGLISDRAQQRLGAFYPAVKLPEDLGGEEAQVLAWLWARTVKSPNPAFAGVDVPLVSTFMLSTKKGKEAYVEPVVAHEDYTFVVNGGKPEDLATTRSGTKLGRGSNFRCLVSGAPIAGAYIKAEGQAGRLGATLMAVVAKGARGRIYLSPTVEQEAAAREAKPGWRPRGDVPARLTGGTCVPYGLREWGDLFSPRQLTAMGTLSDLVKGITDDVRRDASTAGLDSSDAQSYSQAVTTFLALALDRCADFNNSLCRWSSTNEKVMNLFGRQAIPMVWDYAEANILADSVGGWTTCSDYVAACIDVLASHKPGDARQIDAATGANGIDNLLVSTDPPYYDNIGYAALSDFFYVWLRQTIGSIHPDLFSTVLVPKFQELTASPDRFDGSKKKAKEHFESGFRSAFTVLRGKMDHRFPLTVYYAFKQRDEQVGVDGEDSGGVDLTTGWETLLEALIYSGFQITATWPVRASQKWRMVSMGTNALASYIVLACRPRLEGASRMDRRSFLAELKTELPPALRHLQQGNIAPVDFAQAAIGPGMSVYSRYSDILESSGKPLTVRTALSLINQTLTEVLSEQEDDFDADTRWALAWFEQSGFAEGEYGVAEMLSKAKNTSVAGMVEAGIIASKGGKVRLLRPDELPEDCDAATDLRLTVWETVHHLVRVLEAGGESAAATLVAQLGTKAEVARELARELAYRLYTVCDAKKWATEALAYNGLVQSWPEITRLARDADQTPTAQPLSFE